MKKIKAKLGSNFLKKVTRLFDGSTSTIFSELIQNSRRAKATQINVSVEPLEGGRSRVVFEDNGEGVEDLEILLDLSTSGWSDERIETDEDPAGMGVFCLSKLSGGIHVHSRNQKATFTAAVFSADEEAQIEQSEEFVDGMRIVFDVGEAHGFTGHMFSMAIRYAGFPSATLNGQAVQSGALVDANEAQLVNEELGVVVVARRGGWPRSGASTFNFHGVQVSHIFSSDDLNQMLHRLRLFFDIELLHCRRLKMVLPARNAMIKDDGMIDLERELRALLFRCLADRVCANVLPYRFAEQAREEFGISLPEPDLRTVLNSVGTGTWKPDAKVVLLHPCDMEENGFNNQCFADDFHGVLFASPDASMKGYPNYDALLQTELKVTIDGVDAAEALKDREAHAKFKKVAKIELTAEGIEQVVELPFLILNRSGCMESCFDNLDLSIFVTDETPPLADMVTWCVEHLFEPWEGDEADSMDTQRSEFSKDAVEGLAARCMSPIEALRHRLCVDIANTWRFYRDVWPANMRVAVHGSKDRGPRVVLETATPRSLAYCLIYADTGSRLVMVEVQSEDLDEIKLQVAKLCAAEHGCEESDVSLHSAILGAGSAQVHLADA